MQCGADPLTECLLFTLSRPNPLPSEEASIDRPDSWSQKSEPGTQGREQEMNPMISRLHDDAQKLDCQRNRAGDGGP